MIPSIEDIYRRVAAGALSPAAAWQEIQRAQAQGGFRVSVAPAESDENTLFYHPEWQPATSHPAGTNGTAALLPADCLVLGHDTSLRPALDAALGTAAPGPARCRWVTPGDAYRETGDGSVVIRPGSAEDLRRVLAGFSPEGKTPLRVLHTWNCAAAAAPLPGETANLADLRTDLESGFGTLLPLLQAFLALKFRRPLHLLSFHRAAAGLFLPQHSALAGLALTARKENPRLSCRLVGLAEHAGVDALARIAVAEWSTMDGPPEVEVRHDRGRREVRGWAELPPLIVGAAPAVPSPIRTGGVYLITGGLGGLGQIFARELAQRHQARLLLLGRSEPTAAQSEFLRELGALGGQVRYHRADVADAAQLENAVHAARREFGPIQGVIHSAGVIDDALLAGKTSAAAARVLGPKIFGTLALDLATRGEPLDFFALFSSLAAVAGNPGQADYATGNRFLDGFAEWRELQRTRGQRAGRTVAINWPLWAEGGMRVPPAMQDLMQRNWGLTPLHRATGWHAFTRALELGRPQVGVLSGDRQRLHLADLLAGRNSPMPPPQAAPVASFPARPGAPASASTSAPRSLPALEALVALVADVLKVQPSDLNPEIDLHEYGVDSILVMEIVRQLERRHQLELEPAQLIEHNTLRKLAQFVAAHPQFAAPAPNPAPVAASPRPASPATPVPPPAHPLRNGANGTHGTPANPAPVVSASRPAAPSSPAVSAPATGPTSFPPVAVIALACRFPDANNPEEFWANLRAGKCSIGEVPPERWDVGAFYDPDPSAPRKSYSKWGGFIQGVDQFDAAHFKIGEQDAIGMDPQQRILLELTQELFDRAGYRREELRRSRTGVFLGGGKSGYASNHADSVPDAHIAHVIVNTLPNMMAGRLAHFFDLRGTVEVTDTACSSSLVSIHRACRSLAAGETEMAVAGGVSLLLDPFSYIGFCKAGALARSPVPYIFDERANGFTIGEGAGLVLLKPLARALADGDAIAGVILGSAVNNDGHTMGWTTPSLESQRAVLEDAHRCGGVTANQIGYLEAHGTGTLLGDPIEVRAASQVFAQHGARTQGCGLGSLKSNIGHPTHAAGVGGFIKTLLALQHGEIPPTLHCDRPHPRYKFAESPFFLPRQPTTFPAPAGFRCGAVSAFGFGGTNCHIVLRDWHGAEAVAPRRQPLPPTRFKRQRYWLDRVPTAPTAPRSVADSVPASRSLPAPPPPALPVERADPLARTEEVQDFLIAEISRLLSVPPASIDVEAAFDELGLDSTRLLEIPPRLEEKFQVEVYPTLLLEYPTVRRLAAHFAASTSPGPMPTAEREGGHNSASKPELPVVATVASAPASAAPAALPEPPLPRTGAEPAPSTDELAVAIEDFVADRLAASLSVTRDQILPEANFMELGVDSVGLVETAQAFERDLDIALYPTLFFEHSNIRDLSQYFAREHAASFVAYFAKHSARRTAPLSPPPAAPAPPASVAEPTLPASAPAVVVTPSAPSAPADDPSDARAIAIIGMAGRFPEADTVDEFWEQIKSGRNLMREIPTDRWDFRPWFDPQPQVPNKLYCKWGSFVKHVDEFDAPLFRVGEHEAKLLDPQLRLLLEVVQSAADDAGYGARLAGSRTGVFVGSCYQDYAEQLQRAGRSIEPYSVTGNARAMLANRVSYFWDLCGPSLVLDTACSASLVAIHLACQALRNGECDTALAGGVNLILAPERYLCFCSLSALSPTGRCHSFDRRADGYVPGEAVGCVMLKPLAAARRDSDPIHAIIRGTATSHGGYATTVTAPNPKLEAAVITAALRDGAVSPDSLSYIEAHGTGTKLGDPVEIEGLKIAFKPFTQREAFCAIGTAKAHMGHAEGAAGVTGLIKTILAMKHGLIPAMPEFAELNPLIRLEHSPFYFNRAPQPWTSPDGRPLRAGISSFGFGGTYAHLILESCPTPPAAPPATSPDAPESFVWSANHESSLHLAAAAWRAWLATPAGEAARPADLACTLQTGRRLCRERLAIVASHRAELREKLDLFLRSGGRAEEGIFRSKTGQEPPRRTAEDARKVSAWHQAGDLSALAAFWVAGGEIDWAGLHPVSGQRRRCLSAPTYAFARRRYWFDPVAPGTPAAAEPARPALPPPIANLRPTADPASTLTPAAPSPTPQPATTSTLEFICATVASLVNLAPGELAPSANLADLGLDSIQGMHLVRAIQERFTLPLHANEVMAQPDLASLARYVDAQLAPAAPAQPAGAPLARSAAPALAVSPAGAAELPVAAPAATRVATRPILFVLSAPRSGSTLLRVMLAGHSRLFCPPELHLLPFQDMRQRSRALSGQMKFLNEGLVRAVMDLNKCSAPEATALVDGLEARNASVAEVFSWLQELAGDRLLVDKSPSYGEDPAVLRNAARLDGQARYIFLTRHPGAVIESFVRNRFDKMLGHTGGDPWRLGEEVWTRINRNIAEFKGEVPSSRWWDVRYEDLVTTPEASARELCRFLDVPFEPSLLTPYAGERMTDGVHAVSLSIGDPNFLKHDRIEAGLAEEWRSRLPATLALGAPTVRLAAALGYPLDAQCRTFPALSPAQRLLLAESPADPRWHIVHRLRFAAAAPIDRTRFEQAWHDVIARHPRAHTLYQPQGDSAARDPAPIVEWTTRPPADTAETAIAAMFARLNATVDARQGPLMRVVVLEGADHGVELLWVVHHLAGDGLAGEILLREVLRTYAGLPLPALPRPTFDDYCRAAAAAETGPTWRLAREYWRERTPAPAFAVPADRPGGPARQEDERELQVAWEARGAHWPNGAFDHFSVALYQALGDWTGHPGPTLCHRLHGRKMAHRIYDGVFGFFAHDVPLALTLPDGAGGASLLRQFRAAFNQIPDVPYPSLVLADGLPPAHQRSAVRLNFQPLPAPLTEGPLQVVSREIRTYLPPDAPRPYALDLIVRLGPLAATVIARYSASHYDASTLHRLLARWQDHLGQLADQA